MDIEKKGGVYRSDNIVVAAYPTQDILAASYLRAKQEGILHLFFNEDENAPLLMDFMARMANPEGVTYGAFFRTPSGELDCIGLGRVSPAKSMGGGYTKAETAMLFFRQYQHREFTVPACQLMIEMTFDRTLIDFLFGTTPYPNRAATSFIAAAGFHVQKEPLPHYTTWEGQPCGVLVSSLSEEDWRILSPFKEVLPNTSD